MRNSVARSGNPTQWTAWLGFAAGLIAVVLLTFFSVEQIQTLIDPTACTPPNCPKPEELFLPLAALLVGWLVVVTAVMAVVIKAKPWR